MIFSPLFLKYAVIFTGLSSAAAAPLIYSFGDKLSAFSFRGGRPETSDYQLSQVSAERRKTLSEQDIRDYVSTLSSETNWNDLTVNHAFFEHMKKTVDLNEFKSHYGAAELKEEDLSGGRVVKKDIGPNGAKDMTVLDAWEKFFREDKKGSATDNVFSYFKEGGEKLPFWNYDFPYIAVEFPKNYKLPEGLVKSSIEEGWIKVDQSLLPTGLEQYGTKWKGLTDSAYNFKKVMNSTGQEREDHKRSDTLNKIMRASPDADLYLVSSPEKLLRMWLGEWKDSTISETSAENKYALFKNNYYQSTQDHPEVSVLSRWHNGKTYRMWIHHKTLNEGQVKSNSSWKNVVAGRNRFSVGKEHKYVDPKLKWGNNFLLNLMTWYAYTYKLEQERALDKTTYQTIAKAGSWNLREIYDLDRGANSKNPGYKDNFAKWIKDWYSGDKRDAKKYWEDVYNKFNLTSMTHFANRWERIKWVGQAMDELSDKWGQVSSVKASRK